MRLSSIAGERIDGKVAVTDASGRTTVYESLADAEKAVPASADVEYRRGGFFLGDASKTFTVQPMISDGAPKIEFSTRLIDE